MGIAFWMDGAPGRAVIVNVPAPRTMAPGIRRLGTPACSNNVAATGNAANATTNTETPP